jgi:hypothetical protein
MRSLVCVLFGSGRYASMSVDAQRIAGTRGAGVDGKGPRVGRSESRTLCSCPRLSIDSPFGRFVVMADLVARPPAFATAAKFPGNGPQPCIQRAITWVARPCPDSPLRFAVHRGLGGWGRFRTKSEPCWYESSLVATLRCSRC